MQLGRLSTQGTEELHLDHLEPHYQEVSKDVARIVGFWVDNFGTKQKTLVFTVRNGGVSCQSLSIVAKAPALDAMPRSCQRCKHAVTRLRVAGLGEFDCE